MAVFIDDHACVDPRAQIAEDVVIGPFSVVGPHARIGRGTRLMNNVTLMGHVELGAGNILYPNVVLGAEPQDMSYKGSATRVTIGDGNTFREGVTVNRASEKESGVTRIGSNCYLMAACHVAHDCVMGNNVTMANGTLLGGHVHVEDNASLSGAVAVHHYGTIGRYAFVGGHTKIIQDVPPFMLVDGNPARIRCINVVGLKRNLFSPAALHALHEAHRLIFRAKVGLEQARAILEQHGNLVDEAQELLEFVGVQQQGQHGRARERLRAA
jgi:UDP-N-acetylglucosamine acyltransferase